MNHTPTLLAAAISVAAMIASAPASAADLRFATAPIEGQYIVVLKEDVASLSSEASSRPRVATMARDIARTHRADLVTSFQHALRGFVVRASDDALARLLADNRIAYVEEDGVVHAFATQQNATWGLDRSDQRDLPLSSSYTYDTTASTVNAYIIDTGIRSSHGDFGGRVRSGYTAINDGNGTNDCNGHGTHVAGTVGGATWGIAKGVSLYPVRVLGCTGSGSNSGVISGMDWVAGNHVKPAVANMSLGGGASSATDDAVQRMTDAGVTVVVAAGNDNSNACNYSPARAASAVTVGSTTSSDARSSFSNYGSCLDIFGPGSSITSAWHTSNTATNTISGTSMASPHVAGGAALYLASNPGASPSQVTNALINNASTGKISSIGSGSPNRLLYTLSGGGGDPDPTPGELQNGVAVSNLSGASGSETRFTMSVPAGASNLVFNTTGGSGDADLYVKFGSQPTTSSYDCRPYRSGNEETCSFASPQSGTWYVMVHGYSAYSGLTLTGSYDTGDGAPCTDCTKYSGSLSGSGASQVQPDGNYYYSAAGTHKGWLKGPTSADFDLELYRWNGSSWTRVARSISSTSEEHISYDATSGYYYWRIVSYSGSGSYDFWLQRP
ncbi:S8 family peptidase [Lysobacter sp. D1-1-M9]|uniref:S8 family peptidase n=1 Tax=Novilysobacter longmucuonensis TaxID=3098603 RepID=UPI002FCA6A04